MFDRYTDRARRVIILAQEHARVMRHPAIDVEHVLLGLAAEGEGVAYQALDRCGLLIEALAGAVTGVRPPGAAAPAGHMPFTLEAKRALELGLRESIKLGHPYIGTEHLLLGVLADCEARPASPCAQVLSACEVAPARVREAVMTLLQGYGEAPEEGPAEEAAKGDPLALVLARLDGIARDVGAIRKHLGVPD